ncbi:MAG: peptidylprolyl isomerase [Myxococcota bacterium]
MNPPRIFPALLVAGLLAASCRSPRDPDLDRRIAAASADEPTEAPPTSSAPREAAGSTGKKAKEGGAPPRGEVVLRTYSEKDRREIMSAIPGEGPTVAVTIDSAEGEIHCTLEPAAAPQTVANFVALAQGLRPWRDPDTQELMKTRFYDGLSFHRAIDDFIIQTGRPGVRGGTPGWRIPHEEGLAGAYEEAGVMAMVDAGDDSHGSQFFITLRPAAQLADRYTPFGRCGDLDVVKAIANAPKRPTEDGESATKPAEPVRIDSIRVRRSE